MSRRRLLAGLLLWPATAVPQSRKPLPAAPVLSARREAMAGTVLPVEAPGAPAGGRIAIARIGQPASTAIVVAPLPERGHARLHVPGAPGVYEVRLTVDGDGAPTVLLRQELRVHAATARVGGPSRVRRGQSFSCFGNGPDGPQDRVTLVAKDASPETIGPFFFPAENIESTLEAPDTPGTYELRYVMTAPLAEHVVLARLAVEVA